MATLLDTDFAATPQNTATVKVLATGILVESYGSVRIAVNLNFNSQTNIAFQVNVCETEDGTYVPLYIAGAHASNPAYRTYGKSGHVFEAAEVGVGDQWITFILLVSGVKYFQLTGLGSGAVIVNRVVIDGGKA